jgi:glyoxylase-like metal-dependent hydrolase (beta-lactamase superfamily II)
VEVELVPLGGHSPNQLGILVDRVFFCADVVFPEVAIEKYRIPYLYSLTEHLTSLEHALGVGGDTVVPGHGPIHSQIAEPVAFNRSAIGQAMTAIVDCLDEPATGDDVCTSVFRALDVPVLNAQGYFLLRPTINAYLAHLDRIGEVQLEIVDRVALWSRR